MIVVDETGMGAAVVVHTVEVWYELILRTLFCPFSLLLAAGAV
jgi:hypothetical protein